jgi:putative phage-type endonuclease
MNKIITRLAKYNNTYKNINSIQELNNILDKIIRELDIINLNHTQMKDLIAKYSYMINNKYVLDTNYETNNNYKTLIANLNNKYNIKSNLPFRHNDINPIFGPFSKSWIHDTQLDDDISHQDIKRRRAQFDKLNSIKYPEQRTPEWFAQRDKKITASDAGVVVGDNHYEFPYRMIVKKTRETFQNNEATYHGKKYEDIAKAIYEYRMNVLTKEFGMVEHPIVMCIGASPDGIISPYKNNGINLTELVGRMLEIKVPLRRMIKQDKTCRQDTPYYWDQVQLQLECCDLDECDFWQCNLSEYKDYEDFLEDTCKSEPFRSKTTSFEKGCLIQLLPKKFISHNTEDYLSIVHEHAKFIHPPKIEMSPKDCKIWYEQELQNLDKTFPEMGLDRIVYWYLKKSKCETIQRDKIWFDENKGKFENMWEQITFVRSSESYKKLFLDFVDSTEFKSTNILNNIYDKDRTTYFKLKNMKEEIEHIKNDVIFAFLNKLKDSKKSDKIYKLIEDNNNKCKNIVDDNELKEELEKLYIKLTK